jgi:hypothetical protein
MTAALEKKFPWAIRFTSPCGALSGLQYSAFKFQRRHWPYRAALYRRQPVRPSVSLRFSALIVMVGVYTGWLDWSAI